MKNDVKELVTEECQGIETVQVAKVCSSNSVPHEDSLPQIKTEVPVNNVPETSTTEFATYVPDKFRRFIYLL